MPDFIPNRVATGKSGAGRYDFKINTEADIDIFDDEMSTEVEEPFLPVVRVGEGRVSDSRSYLRAIDAIERAKSPETIGLALRGLLRDRGEVLGFCGPDLDLDKTREVAKTVADLFTKYPTVTADVKIGECSPGSAAEARGYQYKGERGYFKKIMVINQKKVETDSNIDALFEKNKEDGWFHLVNEDVTPMQYIVTHEFGHLVDYESERTVSPYEVRKAYVDELDFVNAYVQEEPHIAANTSGYAKSCREELLAEAFADVEMNGEKAFDFSKALYKNLVGALK